MFGVGKGVGGVVGAQAWLGRTVQKNWGGSRPRAQAAMLKQRKCTGKKAQQWRSGTQAACKYSMYTQRKAGRGVEVTGSHNR